MQRKQTHFATNLIAKRLAGLLCSAVVILGLILLTGCERMMVRGSERCSSYAEARLTMPRDRIIEGDPLSEWVVELDERMTGACRGFAR